MSRKSPPFDARTGMQPSKIDAKTRTVKQQRTGSEMSKLRLERNGEAMGIKIAW